MEEFEWNDPIPGLPGLTHRGWVTHIYISKLIHHRIRQWLAICLEQSHYQSWRVIYWTIRSKFRWYLNRKTKFSMHENAYKTPSAKWRLFCLGFSILTHPLLDKMAAIQQTTISNSFSWMESFFISIQISLKFVPNGPIDNFAVLVQVMVWRRTGDKPLPEPILTQSTDSYMQH